ncbi:MAG: hypothetical protein COU98_01055 [Candidatus Staskawiczbacteria bacterium CG10_big_fil_rev_8_21_14_0_10_38_10]|uniref:DUF6938 domain-containing protein n=1 Tax=Candidatus Staskawiczbacteria bacterium CG10_big_fil_rev_8_21_14_0_10_38_10 TaxID=1974891 RepID=A0A2H9T1I1_9BACT|nr:MAG: hypothetical protein COU98_01055 [Candidatus Staskawiczbacteria bacterium CG10_big_fil_rev_8_21_14_0_10_38_10]
MERQEAEKLNFKKAWVITVDMGYGHQRTAYPLEYLTPDQKITIANNYIGIPKNDRKIWGNSRRFYEFISRFKRIPIIGNAAFSLYDQFQQIPAFYPHRDLSKPTLSLQKIYSIIKKGWGKDLIEKLKQKPLPIVSTFFVPAFMAEVFDYPNEIFCVVCDADISRTWAPLNPQNSRIRYLAPNSWVAGRLKLYGVKKENIFLTGFPLPRENIGSEGLEILKEDIARRILNLNPNGKFRLLYEPLIEKYIGKLPQNSDHPLTIMFAIGGAGALKEIPIKFIKSLKKKIKNREVNIILGAGIRETVKDYFFQNLKKLGLENNINKNIKIIFTDRIEEYFKEFNQILRKTDILWTKPSELSFYAALGVPIIIAPSIGSQEDFNRRWLLSLGAGILSEDPKYADQWIFDYIKSGRFAEAAIRGLIEVEKLGTYKIEKIVSQFSK